QAVMQVLQRQWDPTFSDHSYGFRPGQHRDDNGGAGPLHAGLAQLFRLLRNATGTRPAYSLGPVATSRGSLAAVENSTSSPSCTSRTGGTAETGVQHR